MGASGAASSCFLVIQLPKDNVCEENVSIMNCLGLQYHLRFPLDYAAMKQRRFNVTLDVDRKMSACSMPDKSKRRDVLNPLKMLVVYIRNFT